MECESTTSTPGNGQGESLARPRGGRSDCRSHAGARSLAAASRKEQCIMSDTLTYQQMGAAARDQAHTLFAQTMGYVAATAGLFALGAWAGHGLTGGIGIVA